MKLALFAMALILTAHSYSLAADISGDNGRSSSSASELSDSVRRSIESRKSDTTSKSSDKTNSTSKRSNKSRSRDGKLDLTLPARALIPEEIVYVQPVDFDLAAKVEADGNIDQTYNDILEQAKRSSAYIDSLQNGADIEEAVRLYIVHLAKFGARAGQAQIILNSYFAKLGGSRKKAGTLKITTIGADDLAPLAAQAWVAAASITDNRIERGLMEIVSNQDRCRFSPEGDIVCGKTTLKLSTPPLLRHAGIVWYSADQFAGLGGNYSVSTSWSLSDSFEKSAGISDATRKEVAELESRGDSQEAAQTKRKSMSKDRGSKVSISPSKFIKH